MTTKTKAKDKSKPKSDKPDYAALKKQYDANAERNNHTQNAILLAKEFGTPTELQMANDAIRYRNSNNGYNGGEAKKHMTNCHNIHMKYFRKLLAKTPLKEETMEDNTKDIVATMIGAVASDDLVTAKDAFQTAMNDKLLDVLADTKKEIAAEIAGGEVEDEVVEDEPIEVDDDGVETTEDDVDLSQLGLSDEELETLASMSDEDLDEILAAVEAEIAAEETPDDEGE